MEKLEKSVRLKTAEFNDRDFRLSLIESSNDGTMVWKIPQFSQRMSDTQSGKYTSIFNYTSPAHNDSQLPLHSGRVVWKIPQFHQRMKDTQSGKYSSIFSLPFYTGRYGYKMCLRLYILGDGIGKGTHMSLFFIIMKGEFDNILHWPFTHKVTLKLLNQGSGCDIVDTFQPDPMTMSSSFQKPKSDMNVASGCPHFASHAELNNNGFIADDTIFIECIVDTEIISDTETFESPLRCL